MSKEQILSNSKLIEEAVANDEGKLVSNGAFLALTGSRTGRSPKDRFIVEEASTRDQIEWGNINQPFNSDDFNNLWDKVSDYLSNKKHYKTEVHVGSNKDHYIPVEVKCEKAWHSLFSKLIFIVPDKYNSENKEAWQLISAPDFVCDPEVDKTNSDGCVIINFHKRRVLIAGMKYAGEIKKSMFSVQNFLLPEKNVLPMHCSANTDGHNSALFFGLSGTGKTTLSADPDRALVGDDEHGWSEDGVFNFEGGCYAKLINLSEMDEPAIFATTRMKGTILENVVLNADGTPDFTNDSLTQNTRGSYSIEAIENRTPDSMAGNPKNVVFLTCDAFGVLPPLSRLTPEQAAYHFISGYTAKVAGTEIGITEPQATFSTCFGAPFMPRHPSIYADLLSKKIRENDAKCWLINTGWVAGGYGDSSRIKIKWTRALLNAALSGDLDDVVFVKDQRFGFSVPTTCEGVPDSILQPRQTWNDKKKFDNVADLLARMFIENFEQYKDGCSDEVMSSSPIVLG